MSVASKILCIKIQYIYKSILKKNCLRFNYMILVHLTDCALKWLICFYAVLFWFDSLMFFSLVDRNMRESSV